MKIKTALIVVDLQNDYIDGNMTIPYSNIIINKINKIQNKFDIVCFSKNIFDNDNIEKEIIKEKIKISDTKYYCIKDTNGIKFPNKLKINNNIFIRNYNNDGFSALKAKKDNKSLNEFLNENKITHIFICGLPGDYSVKFTAIESLKTFKTYIVIDLLKTMGNINYLIKFMIEKKIPFVNSEDLEKVINGLKSKPGQIIEKQNKFL